MVACSQYLLYNPLRCGYDAGCIVPGNTSVSRRRLSSPGRIEEWE